MPHFDDLWTQPKLIATTTKKYADCVYDSTTELHQGVRSILSTLDRRAIALTKLANYESALHNAKLMQQLSPSSGLGYLCEARIYSEQGKQRHVIDICSKGLSYVDANDPDYTTLQQAKTDAEQRHNTRIDFIRKLLFDIVTTTLAPMIMIHSKRSIIPLLDAPHVWRSCIIQHCRGLYFRTAYGQAANRSMFTRHARYITSLIINPYTQGTWLGDSLRKNGFRSLRGLHIRYFKANCVDDLVSSLKAISITLTQLRIDRPVENMALPIADILTNCPNLVLLEISQPSVLNISSFPTLMTWPKLTTLRLSNGEKEITCDDIKAIGKHFPSLKRLSLYPCKDVGATGVVVDCFPLMRSLDILRDYPSLHLGIKDPAMKGLTYQVIGVHD